MSDASSTEVANAVPGTGAVDPAAGAVAKPIMTISGYCAECGTWDAHGLVCSTCGYDFGGPPTD